MAITNQRGSMLIMTMIFVGTMAGILYIVSGLSTNASKDSINESHSVQAEIFLNGIRSALMNQPQCSTTLGVTKYYGDAENLSTLSLSKSAPVQKGKAFGTGLKVSQMRILPNPKFPMKTLVDGSRQYFANFHVELDGGETWVSRKSRTDIPIRINTDLSGKVLSCAEEAFFSASSEGIDKTCLNSNLQLKATTEILASVFNVYFMIRSKQSSLGYYCVTPLGEVSGFMTACLDGKCLWDK